MKPDSPRAMAFEAAVSEARRHMVAAQPVAAMPVLQRAHVLGQRAIGPHLRVRLLRLVLTPIGHLSGRLPLGNTGTSNVSAVEPMALPLDLEQLLQHKRR